MSRKQGNTGGYSSSYIRPTTRLAIYLRDGLACVYCGCDGVVNGLTLDHVIKRTQGGSHDPRNLVTACFQCNRFLQDAKLKDLARKLGTRVERLRRIRDTQRTDITIYLRQRAQRVRRERPPWYVALMHATAATYRSGIQENNVVLVEGAGAEEEEEEIPF